MSVFCARAKEVGLRITQSSPTTLGGDVAALIHRLGSSTGSGAARPKVIVEPSLFCRRELERSLAAGVELLDPCTGDEAMFAADVGVTGVHAAVAETGSIICASGRELWRGLTLIPPAHIAVVRRGQIVPDLVDLFANLSSADLPGNVTLISGPSKTADIEGILITGVHGPGEVHVVLIREQQTEPRP